MSRQSGLMFSHQREITKLDRFKCTTSYNKRYMNTICLQTNYIMT